jgi:hypothetical protein
MAFADRLRLATIGAQPRLAGPLRFATTVIGTDLEHGAVVRTTRLSKWGMTLLRSVEIIRLDHDGRSFVMRSEPRFWPTLSRARDLGAAHGEGNETASGATYRIPWFGGELIQRTRLGEDGLQVTQEMPWLRAAVPLRREPQPRRLR